MTFSISQVAKTYIFAARQARTRADLTAWVESQRARMETVLPTPLASGVLDEARQHYRELAQ